jgi:hypothetical protein
MTHRIPRDLEWWRAWPTKHNGRSIYKPIETAYLHTKSNGYGWGALLNDNPSFKVCGFGMTATGSNTSPGRSYEPCVLESSPSYPSYGDATSYYTRKTLQSCLPTSIWAGILSSELDCDDWQQNPIIFGYLQAKRGPQAIDRFASMEKKQLPRFNAEWRDPECEDIDRLHVLGAA